MSTPPGALTDPAQLRDHYREPHELVLAKDVTHVDETAAAFIAASTFCLIGSHSAAGEADVSPKGGAPGFVRVPHPERILIPDLNGNNRLDSLTNIIETGQVGLLFLVPQRGETMRVNGRAWVSVDGELLESFTDQYRRPASVIVVEPTQVFLHCAKCIRRGGLWNPESWGAVATVPSSGTILAAHAGLDGQALAIDDTLDAAYAVDLEADKP